jgi:hypothetical protein
MQIAIPDQVADPNPRRSHHATFRRASSLAMRQAFFWFFADLREDHLFWLAACCLLLAA